MGWTPPQTFDGYLLFRLLGRGGMGEVHLASDTLLDRQVAIKFISAPAVDRASRQRFLVEARAVARLQHPNVVAVHRIGLVEGTPYLVSEYVDGDSLHTLLGQLSARQILSVATDLAGALACAHGQGILHRDIKPANVILNRQGQAKLLDFGIAKFVRGAGVLPDFGQDRDDPLSVSAASTVGDADRESPLDEDATPAGIRPVGLDEDGLQLTRPGTLMGSPRYMAPELWQGHEASFATDVYSFGALIFALCVGRPPFQEKDMATLRERVCRETAPSLAELAPQFGVGLTRLVDCCLARDPSDRYADGKALRVALAQLGKNALGSIHPEGNPYRGLHVFEAEHSNLFFGRDSETRMILERLRREPVVLVVGDSGVGKSSLCRAAVLPRVDGWLGESRRWRSVSMSPGPRPLDALAEALAASLGLERAAWREVLREDPLEASRILSSRLGQDQGLVLFVDQLEELLTQSQADQFEAAIAALAWLVQPIPGLRVLATVRGDHLSRLASLTAFGDELTRGLYFLRPLSSERLREAITGPAKGQGVSFESAELVDQLVQATEEAEGGLPLLQFALAELWDAKAEAKVIGWSALESIGGVSGALSRHADGVLERMLPPTRQAARELLSCLVHADGTRARRSAEELGLEHELRRKAIDALVSGRLVVARQGAETQDYCIAHEALVQAWARLARWLMENAELRQLQESLRRAAAEWRRLAEARTLLWSGPQLAECRLLDSAELGQIERDFLAASRGQRRRTRAWRWGLGLGLPILMLAGWMGMHLAQQLRFEAQIDDKLSSGQRMLDRVEERRPELEQQRRQAYALFDEGRLKAAEAAWEQVRRQEGELSRQALEAAALLESTSWLDRERQDLRRGLARSLLLLARLSQEAGRKSERDGFILRLQAMEALPAGLSQDAALRPALPMLKSEPGASPPGWVHIPAGQFYFGSGAADDQRREFFKAVPIHVVRTEAYRIARHETTFGQWMEFLMDLPPERRQEMSPRVGKEGFTGAVDLTRSRSGTWRLRLKPTTQAFVLEEGQFLEYPERARLQRHDWRKLPVVGVSVSEARAYCRWLDDSGRLPGARLCTELEWERAARGADDREFPHGRILRPEEANFDESHGKRTESMGPDEVGSHPASTSPYGLLDMAGNVWELCVSALQEGQVVARGGSFYFGMNSCRVTDREVVEPAFRDVSVGFRVCADPP